MKKLDELVRDAFPDELTRLSPAPVDEKAVRQKAFVKLGLNPEEKTGGKPVQNVVDFEQKKQAVHGRRKGFRAAAITVSSLAACLVLMLSVNAAFPAFAESLPGIGGVFRYLNGKSMTYYNPGNQSRIEEHAGPITDSMASAGEEGFSFTVKEAYYDGKFIYAAAEIHTDFDPNDDSIYWEYQVSVNGVQIDMWNPIGGRDWIQTGENIYVSDQMSIYIPEEYRPQPGDIEVAYTACARDLSEVDEETREIHPKVVEETTVQFTAKYDAGEVIEVAGPAEQNGISLLSLATSPSSTEIVVEASSDIAGTPSSQLEVELNRPNGEVVTMYGSNHNDGSPGMVRITEFGDGLLKNDKQVIVSAKLFPGTIARNGEAGMGDIIAEFTVDLERKTITPSERWKDPDDPLYWNPDIFWSPKRAYPSYRAPDSALENLSDGYKVEFFTKSVNFYDSSTFLNLVTNQEYRDLEVEILRDGAVVQRGWSIADMPADLSQDFAPYTNPFGRDRKLFQPYADYNPTEFNLFDLEIGREKFPGWVTYTGAELPREMEKTGLNSQVVYLEGPLSFYEPDTAYTVRVTDQASGGLLHEETVTVTMPEDLQVGEDETLLRLRTWDRPYVIVKKSELAENN